MRIGFYAPLKPPHHPAPSGDRRVARLFMAALRGLGHEVDLLSDLRSFNRDGDAAREAATADAAAATVDMLSAAWRQDAGLKPDLLFTYHVYHKAADYIAPALKQRFGLPYVIAEASDSPRRRDGAWAAGYAQARRAITAADALLAITHFDLPPLVACVGSKAQYFAPFLDPLPFSATVEQRGPYRAALAKRFGLPLEQPWLLAVGMMRSGDKLTSFQRLAETLSLSLDTNWHCLLVGDGPERASTEAAFGPLGGRITFTGQLDAEVLAPLYAASDLYIWPAVNEAYGMALLEAQAAGLPVLSVNTRGVPDIVAHGETGWLTDDDHAETLATALRNLLGDPARRQRMAAAAPPRVARGLSLASAQLRLQTLFSQLGLPA